MAPKVQGGLSERNSLRSKLRKAIILKGISWGTTVWGGGVGGGGCSLSGIIVQDKRLWALVLGGVC